jgi:hypothetical protein
MQNFSKIKISGEQKKPIKWHDQMFSAQTESREPRLALTWSVIRSGRSEVFLPFPKKDRFVPAKSASRALALVIFLNS